MRNSRAKWTDADLDEIILFKHSTRVQDEALTWSYSTPHPFKEIFFFVPLRMNKATSIWVFAESNDDLDRWKSEGFILRIEERIRSIMMASDFPADLFDRVAFHFDSHENVVKNHEGNYFRRIRGRK